jgi:hypothetical protein
MDSKQFRKPTLPRFGPTLKSNLLEMGVSQVGAPPKTTEPIADQRYPQYIGPMSDGRFITDYRPQCAANVLPSEYGNTMRSWMQNNGDALIQTSRKRQADRAGAQYKKAATVPPSRQVQQCDIFECKKSTNNESGAIGLDRVERVPRLFGTFSDYGYGMPASRDFQTLHYEGGRNTPRGRSFQPLGLRSAF